MGQTHGKQQQQQQQRQDRGLSGEDGGGLVSSSSRSPSIPGSPVTYSPQLPMEPLKTFGGVEFGGDSAGWGMAEPKGVPTVIVWCHGGNHVELEGSFDNWTTRHVMQQSGKDFNLVKMLLPGVYQYKFIVDGQWRHDPNLPWIHDDQGNLNNVLTVQEYVAENLERMSEFEPPASPVSSYASQMPSSEDFVKEPPGCPPSCSSLCSMCPLPWMQRRHCRGHSMWC